MKLVPFLLIGGLAMFFCWMIMRLSEVTLHQHDSEAFPHVPGIVVSSEITTTHGSRGGTHYHVHVSYRYAVDGVDYTGYHYRYDGHPTGGAAANDVVDTHPAGAAVVVYYNPQNPQDTVLSTDVDQEDIALPFMIAGMTLLLFGVFVPACRELFSGSNQVAGGVKIISEMLATRVRLPRYEPAKLGLLTAGGLALLCALLTATSVAHPPWAAAKWSLAGILVGAAAVYAVQFQKIRSGRQDLVIDEAGRTVQLPLTYQRRERTPKLFTDIRSVLLNKVRHQSKSRVYYTYLVTLELDDGAQEKLVDLKLNRAKAFAAWLREKVGVPAPKPAVELEEEET